MNSQWDDYLPSIQYAFNTRVIELHGSSPYSLLFGRSPNNFADYRDTELTLETPEAREQRLLFLNSLVFPAILEKVGRAHAKRTEDFIRTHRMLKEDFPSGSQVMVRDEMRTQKHQPVWEGPFTVLRRKASGNYELKGLDGTVYTRPFWVLKLVAPEIIKGLKISDTLYAAVDHIITHRELVDGSMQYQVRWEDKGPEFDTWLFAKDFVDYGPVQKYSKGLGVDIRTKKAKKSSLKKGCNERPNREKKKLEFHPDLVVEPTHLRSIELEEVNENAEETPITLYWDQQLPNKRVRK